MPEYPDITIYIERLENLIKGQPLEDVRLVSPFLLRTVEPTLEVLKGAVVEGLERMGKRIVIVFPGELFMVLHLMIAGRLHWRKPGSTASERNGLAAFDFPHGSLILTEASSKRRVSLHIIQGREQLQRLDPGGLEILNASCDDFYKTLTAENHTLKRALTDPRLFSGIGNAYSDEILHRARLSPILLTEKLNDQEIERLYSATKETLLKWTQYLREETGEEFPKKVTAFHQGMAVHGRYGKPCPKCETPIQRIRYASNETNYCPLCQTKGKLLADRALSRLLKKDWPRTFEELENQRP